jgi:hypothetical protein
MDINSAGQVVYVPRQPSPPPNLQNLYLKSEVDRRKTFKYWRVPFIDVNQLAATGFFFTNRGEAVGCAFCEVEVGQWVKGDYAFKEHQRLSPSCAFVKMLCVGNIPAPPKTSQQQPSSSNDMCGPHMEYTLKTSRPKRKYTFTFIYLCTPMYDYNSTLIFNVFYSYKIQPAQ